MKIDQTLRNPHHDRQLVMPRPSFPLTAKLNKMTIKVDRPKLSPQDIEKLEKAEAEALDGSPLRHVQAGPQ